MVLDTDAQAKLPSVAACACGVLSPRLKADCGVSQAAAFSTIVAFESPKLTRLLHGLMSPCARSEPRKASSPGARFLGLWGLRQTCAACAQPSQTQLELHRGELLLSSALFSLSRGSARRGFGSRSRDGAGEHSPTTQHACTQRREASCKASCSPWGSISRRRGDLTNFVRATGSLASMPHETTAHRMPPSRASCDRSVCCSGGGGGLLVANLLHPARFSHSRALLISPPKTLIAPHRR